MNIYISCAQCINQSTDLIDKRDFQFYKVNVNENGLYKFTCYKGHETMAISPYDKYEILFQMGANALLDGYYFEAVSCFAASVERFREWCIRFFWSLNGIEESEIKKVWGKLKRSEPQSGAFHSMYLNHFKVAPPIFNGNRDKFRNNVIHNGLIPNYNSAHDFGNYAFDLFTFTSKKNIPRI
ncbi:hypothetical protein [Bacillus salipaludis]|uniref:hypothetical protein n=1 Tax=Bacillus salipaludis TaxID=2547811 RepID=UPI002E234DFE|nr:hypothetical protein [Bacillus salipaludis]